MVYVERERLSEGEWDDVVVAGVTILSLSCCSGTCVLNRLAVWRVQGQHWQLPWGIHCPHCVCGRETNRSCYTCKSEISQFWTVLYVPSIFLTLLP